MNNEINEFFNEMQCYDEELFREMNKRIIKVFSNNIDTFDMKTILNRITRDQVYELTKVLGLKGVSSLNKAKLIDVFIDNYEQLIYSKLILFDESRFNGLQTIVNNNGVCILDDGEDFERAGDYISYGLLYAGSMDGMPACVMPSLVMDIIKKYSNDIIMRKALKVNQEIITLTRGMLEAYGVISIDDLVNKLNMYGIEKNEFYIQSVLLEGIDLYDYYFQGMFIVSDYIDYEEVEGIVDSCSEDYEFIDKEEIIAMSKEGWIARTKYGKKFMKHLKEIFCFDNEALIDFVESMWLNTQFDGIDYVMDKMLEGTRGEERRSLEAITSDFLNNIRLWDLRGRTRNQGVNKEIVHSVKIGRNDSCPCGSGKKYKKCCGKNK